MGTDGGMVGWMVGWLSPFAEGSVFFFGETTILCWWGGCFIHFFIFARGFRGNPCLLEFVLVFLC